MSRRFSHVRLVTFDLFDTLYTPAEPVSRTYARPLWQHGYKVSEETMGRAFAQAYKEIHTKYPNYGYGTRLTSRQWWELVIDKAWGHALGTREPSLSSPTLVSARNVLVDGFGTSRGYRMYDDVPRVLGYLRRKGMKLGVVSNMDENADGVLRGLGIIHHFDFVLKSVAVGVEKPDPRIFDMALGAVNVQAYDALHVGDSEKNDYIPAVNAGMLALLVNRDPRAAAAALVAKYPEKYVSSLESLLQLI